MKRIQFTIVAVIGFVVLSSHDMFLKLDAYYLQPNSKAVLQLFNGTFEKSDNVIDRNRMEDVSLVGNGNRTAVDSSDWYEKNDITFLNFNTGNEGTWVAGLSTKARDIELEAEAFNTYLKSDGVLDMLENRKKSNTLNSNAVEKYAKHVKTIFQVGNKRSNDWNVNLGYPLEFIPLQNPYDIHSGHNLEVRLLYNGKPLKNHFVYVGTEAESTKKVVRHSHDGEEAHSHSHTDAAEASEHAHPATKQFKTNANGVVNIDINKEGTWYLRTIKMIESNDTKLTHESNWATLTFGIGAEYKADQNHDQNHDHDHDHDDNNNAHQHGSDTHSHEGDAHSHGDDTHTHDGSAISDGEATHTHQDHDEDHFPSYIFWMASILVVGVLFFWFNRKQNDE